MSLLRLRFKPWRRIRAYHDRARIRNWLNQVGDATIEHFQGSMGNYPPPSAPGAFPNIRTGKLSGSIRKRVGVNEVEVGSGVFYAIFLATGTYKMAKRKMSKEALEETLPKLRGQLKGFARWRIG